MSEANEVVAENIINPYREAAARGLALFDSGGGELVRVVAQSGNFNKNGHGTADYRRVVLPGQTVSQWANQAGECEGNFDRRTQNGTDYVFLPEGTIVLAYDTTTNKFGKGRAVLTPGIIVRHKDKSGDDCTIVWGEKAGLVARRKGDVPIVTLPDGRKLTF